MLTNELKTRFIFDFFIWDNGVTLKNLDVLSSKVLDKGNEP